MHYGTPGDDFDREFDEAMKWILKFIKLIAIGCATFVLAWLFMILIIMALIVYKSCV